jgi:hypothetical protein
VIFELYIQGRPGLYKLMDIQEEACGARVCMSPELDILRTRSAAGCSQELNERNGVNAIEG